MSKKPVVLMVLDGYGLNENPEGNAIAMANTPVILPYKFEDMVDIMMGLVFEGKLHFGNPKEMHQMYILTNRNKINGAGCILYPDVLKTFADMMVHDLYIIPSSVHETLLIPIFPDDEDVVEDPDSIYYGMTQEEMLNAMIQEVNITQLTPEEVLSDHAYKYIRATGEIVM